MARNRTDRARRRAAVVASPTASNTAPVVNPILRHMDLSTKIRDLRTKASTKRQYSGKAMIFTRWLEHYHPFILQSEPASPWIANINDHPEILEDFFGHICQKTNDDDEYFDPPRFQSYHHVNGYKSAIFGQSFVLQEFQSMFSFPVILNY
jgi:hypothetical protein